MVNIYNIRKSICEIAKILFIKGLIDSSGGNISVYDGKKVYISPRRSGHDHQWNIEEDSIIVTDLCKITLTGEEEQITREASSHYKIYQNFPDIGAIIHSHPAYIMAFGAAHMDLPAISEGTRAILGEQPITNIEESIPGSAEQAQRIIENFKRRRQIDAAAPLICNLPFHGIFAAGSNLNDAFLYTEVANNCAQILILRKIMFGDDPKADFSIHKTFTKEDFATIDEVKEVCKPGYIYKNAFGDPTVYNDSTTKENEEVKNLAEEIIKEVMLKLKSL